MEEKLVNILNEMAEYLNISQLKKLQEVLLKQLSDKSPQKEPATNADYLKLFLDAKKIEGCSDRTIKYYRVTIEHLLAHISTPVRKNRNLLVIKDSYANCFIPFLTQDYRTITVVDPRYYYENIATVIKANDIDEVLFLYNANTFFSDNYMRMMLTNK
jgi:hypothetical protein